MRKTKVVSDKKLDKMLVDASRQAEKRGESDMGEYDRQILIRKITLARMAVQLPAIKLDRMGLTKLQRIWRRTIRKAKKAGLIE